MHREVERSDIWFMRPENEHAWLVHRRVTCNVFGPEMALDFIRTSGKFGLIHDLSENELQAVCDSRQRKDLGDGLAKAPAVVPIII